MGACFRTNSRDLCNAALCPRAPETHPAFQCSRCGPLNLELTDHLCRSRKMTAIKTIRVCNANWLDDLVKSPKLDLKIIHLIRDPRAVARSRRTLHKDFTDDQLIANITSMCQLQMQSHETYATSDDYFSILYEDINRMPIENAAEVFEFLGLSFAPEVHDWIRKNTGQQPVNNVRHRRDLNLADFHLKEKVEYDDKEILLYEDDHGHNYTKTRFNLKKTADAMKNYPPDVISEELGIVEEETDQLGVKAPRGVKTPIVKSNVKSKTQMYRNLAQQKRPVMVNPYGTRRIASNVLERWPNELSYMVVKRIELGCADLLDSFGYKLIGSEEEYSNKSISYLPDLLDNSNDDN